MLQLRFGTGGGSPNDLAVAALTLWPLVVLVVFAARRGKAAIARTTAWMTILPEMFLPANCYLDLPGIPPIDKHRIIILSVALALTLSHPRSIGEVLRSHWFPRLILLLLAAGAVMTVRNNGDEIGYGSRVLPALTDHDISSMCIKFFLDWYLPFSLGLRAFRSESDLRDLLDVLSLGALIYAPLFLLEMRLSPQLHRWVYGYHQHRFSQTLRAGGFRPTLFMYDGVGVAMFLMSGLLASLALGNARAALSPRPTYRALIAGGLVAVSRSMGATVYGLAMLPLLKLVGSKWLGRSILLVVALIIAFPLLRNAQLFPRAEVVAFFSQISPERAASLEFRFTNEEALLARARVRPVFGWGGWGRSRIYSEDGTDRSVTDGYWIILLGTHGYVGFAAYFALLTVPLLRFCWRRRRLPPRTQAMAGGLALLVSVLALDCLPNAPFDFLLVMYAGALYGLTGPRPRHRARPSREPVQGEPTQQTPGPPDPAGAREEADARGGTRCDTTGLGRHPWTASLHPS